MDHDAPPRGPHHPLSPLQGYYGGIGGQGRASVATWDPESDITIVLPDSVSVLGGRCHGVPPCGVHK